MANRKYRLCASIVDNDPAASKKIESMVDFFEVRIDLIGSGWRELAAGLEKPWIACNRRAEEGGGWQGSHSARVDELVSALDMEAAVIDIELATPDLVSVVREIKGRAECLLSYHDIMGTPPLEDLKRIVEKQLAAGADICKVVTTAGNIADNITILKLISCFPGNKIIAFAMGSMGYLSRVLSPLAGGYLTYGSIAEGRESAAGQITVDGLRNIYQIIESAPQ